jgi:hypothetical protein
MIGEVLNHKSNITSHVYVQLGEFGMKRYKRQSTRPN